MYLDEIADTARALVRDTMQFVDHLLAALTFVSILATRLRRKLYRWVHRYTRLDGLQMFANVAQKTNHVEKDPELGGALPHNPAATKKSRILVWWSNSLVRVIVYLMTLGMIIYSIFILLHVLIYASPPQVVERAINQIDFTHLMHTRHPTTDDPLELAVTHDFLGVDEASETIVPYGNVGIAVFADRTMLPPHVAEPCRRLSKKELLSGITLEGYEIPILLARMCDIVHNLVGCDDAGHIIPKMLNTTDDLNVCIITYKDAGGVCSHYINPTVREVLSAVTQEVIISSSHLPFLGEHPIQMRTQGLLTYQPIVEEQIAHDASPEQPIGAVDIAMSEALEKVKDVTNEQWLSFLPKIVTISISIPRIYHFHIAHEGLQGNYPNVLALNVHTAVFDE
jgi:hypothetical protein